MKSKTLNPFLGNHSELNPVHQEVAELTKGKKKNFRE